MGGALFEWSKRITRGCTDDRDSGGIVTPELTVACMIDCSGSVQNTCTLYAMPFWQYLRNSSYTVHVQYVSTMVITVMFACSYLL